MPIQTEALAVLTSAATIVGHEFLKGTASEAAKAAWAEIKSLFNWQKDPAEPAIAEAVASELTAKPELIDELQRILTNVKDSAPGTMVGKIVSNGGDVKIVGTINATTVTF